MGEKSLRNIFIFGSLFFLIILGVMAFDTLSQVQTRTPPLTADVIAGKEIWQAQNCNDCHTLLGIGGYFAPELTKVAVRRDGAWLASFLLDPQAAKPNTTMPIQALTITQADQLVGFFQWVSQVDSNGWPPDPLLKLGGTAQVSAPADDLAIKGEQLFAQKGCNACHMVNGLGAIEPGPDLSTIGSQRYDSLPNDPEFLTLWLENPLAQKPGTTMPRIELTGAEIEALVAYLITLK